MNIMYVSDDHYAMLLGISLTSLLFKNKDVGEIRIFVVDDGIGGANKQKITDTVEKFGREIIFLGKPQMDKLLGCRPDTLKWCDNIFCRLYVPTLLAGYADVKRVLYLDCDTVICSDLVGLWETDLEDKSCAAGLECMSSAHKRLIGLDADEPYVNSGVLLIDIEDWKENSIEKQCSEFIQSHIHCLEYPDEGILNGVLQGGIKILPPRYNLTSIKCTFSYEELKLYRRSRIMYEKREYEGALKSPAIIHYTSNFLIRRPWIEGRDNCHCFENEFIEMWQQSEWRDDLSFPNDTTIVQKIARKSVAIWRRPAIWLCGILYSYLKPMQKKIRVMMHTARKGNMISAKRGGNTLILLPESYFREEVAA